MTDPRARRPDVSVTVATAADGGQQIEAELRKADERLREMIHRYQESPSTLDGVVLAADDPDASAEAAVIRTFRLLLARVYPEDSPLRADQDVWEAFREQRDEFTDFYRSALTALEFVPGGPRGVPRGQTHAGAATARRPGADPA